MLPRIAVTLGDVAGIGPEVIARAWCDARLRTWCRPIVVGHPEVLHRAVQNWGGDGDVRLIARIDAALPEGTQIACWNPAGDDAAAVPP